MGAVLVTPGSEPVSLEELKAHCRVEHANDDTLLTALGKAAREQVEGESSRQLSQATWRETFNEFPEDDSELVLSKSPLIAVTSITYLDENGASQTLASSAYQVDSTGQLGIVLPEVDEEWPTTESDRLNAVTVTYTAGYSTVPEVAKLAIKMLAAHWYEHREAVADMATHEVPLAVRALIQQVWNGAY